MTVKDFALEDIVWIVNEKTKHIERGKVTKIGVKYVTVAFDQGGRPERFLRRRIGDPYLRTELDNPYDYILFKTQEEYTRYMELEHMYPILMRELAPHRIREMTYEQVRSLYAIIRPTECGSTDCIFCNSGTCRYEQAHGIKPTISVEDGCKNYVFDQND